MKLKTYMFSYGPKGHTVQAWGRIFNLFRVLSRRMRFVFYLSKLTTGQNEKSQTIGSLKLGVTTNGMIPHWGL